MAKLPETRERYRIHCETSIEQMGHVLAVLTKLGVQGVGYELIEDQLNFKNKRQHETTASEAIIDWVKDHPTFAISEAQEFFRAQGRTAGAIYTGVKTLVEKGVLKKLGPMNYAIAGMKAIEAPKAKTAKTAKTAKPKTAKPAAPEVKRTRNPSKTSEIAKSFEVTGLDAIRKYMRPRKTVTTQQLCEWFREQGRNPKSVSPLFHKLTSLGELQKTGEPGVYSVNKKTEATMNGAANESTTTATETAEHAHG